MATPPGTPAVPSPAGSGKRRNGFGRLLTARVGLRAIPLQQAVAEEQFAADTPYLTGTEPGIGDIAVTAQLIGLRHAGFGIDAAAYPRLAVWLERMLSRPSFTSLIAEDRERLGSHSRL